MMPKKMPTQLGQEDKIESAVFYCRIADPELLRTLEFYAEDLRMLENLAERVTVCTRWRDLIRAPKGLLWAWWPATAAPAVLVWRLRRLPVVLTGAVDLSNPLETGAKRTTKRWLTRIAVTAATLTLAISEYERRDLAALVPSAFIATLYPGVDCEYFSPRPLSTEPSIVTIAQINPQSVHRKGVDRVVEAFGQVQFAVPDATLTIVGPISPEGQQWIERLRDNGQLAGVEFLGRVERDSKRDLLASRWVYVQPSRYEGFGLALAEAMSSGAQPVASAVGSLPEVIGDAGTVVAEPSPATLARTIMVLLKSPPSATSRAMVAASASRFASSTREARFRAICRESADRRP